MHGDPPYCGYQTGTCPTCGSRNSPRAAYTCHLFAKCPTIQRGTNVVLPIVLIREYAVLRVRECRNVAEDHAARQALFTCSPRERAISARRKSELSREGGNWSASYLCGRKRPEKREKKLRGCSAR